MNITRSRHAVRPALAAAALAAACSGSSPRPAAPPVGRPPPEDPIAVALRTAAADAGRLCACDTTACADQVDVARDHAVDSVDEDPAATPEQQAEAGRLAEQRDQCRARIANAEMEGRLASVMPDCAEYLRLVERLTSCDQMAPAVDGLREAASAMRDSFQQILDLEPDAQAEAIEAARPGCLQAVDALHLSASAMGCEL